MARWTLNFFIAVFLLSAHYSNGQAEQSLLSDTRSLKKSQFNIGINSFPYVIPYYYSQLHHLGQKYVAPASGGLYSTVMYQITYKHAIKNGKKFQKRFRGGIDFYYERERGNYTSIYTSYAGLIHGGIEWYKSKYYKAWKFYYGAEGCILYMRDIHDIPFYPTPFDEYFYGIGIAVLIGIEGKISDRFSFSSELSLIGAFGKDTDISPWYYNSLYGFDVAANRAFGLTANYHFSKKSK